MDNVAAKVGVEVARVAQHFEEAAYSLLSLLLGLLLHVDGLVSLVEVGEDAVDEVEQFERGFIVELHH